MLNIKCKNWGCVHFYIQYFTFIILNLLLCNYLKIRRIHNPSLRIFCDHIKKI